MTTQNSATAEKPEINAEMPAGFAEASDRAIAALRAVYDPEIPVNIYELGLIYAIDLKPREDIEGCFDAHITMTLTAPNCPVAGTMPQMVADAIAKAGGFGKIDVALVFEPPWDKSMMSDEARLALNMM